MMQVQSFEKGGNTPTTADRTTPPSNPNKRLLIPNMRLALDSPISESYQKALLRTPEPFRYFDIPIDLLSQICCRKRTTMVSNDDKTNSSGDDPDTNDGGLHWQTSSHDKRQCKDKGDSEMEDVCNCDNEADNDHDRGNKRRRLSTSQFVTTLSPSTKENSLRQAKCDPNVSHDGDKILEQSESVAQRRGSKIQWSQRPPCNNCDSDDNDNWSTHSLTSQESGDTKIMSLFGTKHMKLESRRRGPKIRWSDHPPIDDDDDDSDDDTNFEDDDDEDDDTNIDDDTTTCTIPPKIFVSTGDASSSFADNNNNKVGCENDDTIICRRRRCLFPQEIVIAYPQHLNDDDNNNNNNNNSNKTKIDNVSSFPNLAAVHRSESCFGHDDNGCEDDSDNDSCVNLRLRLRRHHESKNKQQKDTPTLRSKQHRKCSSPAPFLDNRLLLVDYQ